MFLIVEGDQRVFRLHRVSSLDRGAVNDQNVNESEKRRLISYSLKVFV